MHDTSATSPVFKRPAYISNQTDKYNRKQKTSKPKPKHKAKPAPKRQTNDNSGKLPFQQKTLVSKFGRVINEPNIFTP